MRTTCTAIRLMTAAQHGSRSIERQGMDHGGHLQWETPRLGTPSCRRGSIESR